MLVRELNRGKCKTYLVACERTQRAALIDPVRTHVERYLALLAYQRLTLDALIDTHTHADHPTGSFLLKDLTGCRLIMHRRAPVPVANEHVDDGDTISVGDVALKVLYTPGHTPDSMSLHAGSTVFTGDVLLIREDDSAFLSSLGRGGDRVLYALTANDLRFYLETNELVTGRIANEKPVTHPVIARVQRRLRAVG